MKDLLQIVNQFNIQSEISSIVPLGNGLINNTYLASSDTEQFVLQQINTAIFKEINVLINNKYNISNFLINKGILSPKFIFSNQNQPVFITEDQSYWQLSVYIPNTNTFEYISNAKMAYQVGKTLGEFHSNLEDFPLNTLGETIPDFHHTILRYQEFEKLTYDESEERVVIADEFIMDIRAVRAPNIELALRIYKEEFPTRVVHNDPKIPNILFNEKNKAICLIDLDTVMPGTILHDFGDALRSGANTTKEDDQDLEMVSFDLNIFYSFTDGYLEATQGFITPLEANHLAESIRLLIFEQAVRFLHDYLLGDYYYSIGYLTHNLVRAQNQLKLYTDFMEKFDLIEDYINNHRFFPN